MVGETLIAQTLEEIVKLGKVVVTARSIIFRTGVVVLGKEEVYLQE